EARIAWPRSAIPLAQLAKLVGDARTPLDVMPLLIQIAAMADPARDDLRPDALVARGRQLIPLLAAALAPGFPPAPVRPAPAGAGRAAGAASVAEIAARAVGAGDDVAPMLDRVLVLLADHELNASSFAARIAASTDADPYACIAAALATVSGPRHGTASEQVAQFADSIGSPAPVRPAGRAPAKRGARGGGGAARARRDPAGLRPSAVTRGRPARRAAARRRAPPRRQAGAHRARARRGHHRRGAQRRPRARRADRRARRRARGRQR